MLSLGFGGIYIVKNSIMILMVFGIGIVVRLVDDVVVIWDLFYLIVVVVILYFLSISCSRVGKW